MLTQNKRLSVIVAIVAMLLLTPLIAMQFSGSGVVWTLSDFVIAGILLLGTGLLCELVMRKVKSRRNRLFVCGAILFVLALIWVELAVGLFGSPFAGS